MNNRKRARIASLKRECRARTSKMTSLSAVTFTAMRYLEKIGRVAWGDDLADRMFKDFINTTHGVPYNVKLVWKKTVRTVFVVSMPRAPYVFTPSKTDNKMMVITKPLTVGPTFGNI